MRHLIPLAGLLALAGCTNLPDLTASGTCGNGVLEPTSGEDCEPGRQLAPGLVCGEASDELSCLFLCGDAEDEAAGEVFGVCPDGWSCAYEGYCQAPAGIFGDPQVVSGITTPLGIGDFDGDDYPDLATVQEPLLKVAFGNASTQYAVTLSAPVDAAPTDPVVADVDRDGQDDLILYSGDRLTIYRGQADQTLAPLMVPSRDYGTLTGARALAAVRMNSADANPGEREQGVLIITDADAGVAQLRLADVDDEQLEIQTVPITEAGVLPSNIATGDLWPEADGEPIYHELAFAPYRGQQIVLFSLICAPEDGPQEGAGATSDCDLEEVGQVTAPQGWQLSNGGTLSGDLDGDGRLDLVFGLQGQQGLAIGGALGTVDGFAPAQVLPIDISALGPMAPVMPGAQQAMAVPPSWLLAVADLDGDRDGDTRVDVITATAVMRATEGVGGDPLGYVEGFAPQRRWEVVRVGDLNRDGLPDLVGTSGPSLLTHLNVDGRTFNEHESTLGDNQIDVQLGDFDGDLLPDQLVRIGSRLMLGFNNGRGLVDSLEEAVSLGGTITPLVLRRPEDGDAIDDVLVVVDIPDRPAYLLELQGSGTRRLAAPLQLPELIDAAIAIRSTEGSRGITGQRGEDGWIFQAIDESALLTALSEVPEALTQVGDCHFSPRAGLLFGHYFARPGDPIETLVGIEASTESVVMSYSGPWAPRLVAYDGADTITCTALEPSPFEAPPTRIEVADLDGDRQPDLVVSHAAIRVPDGAPGESQEGGLAIWWSDGAGGFDPTPERLVPTAAPSAQPAGRGTTDDSFRGIFATLETNGVPGLEMLLLFGNGLHLLTFDGAFGDPVLLPRQRVEPSDIERIDTLDIDQDGVTDMILSGPRQAVIVLQEPCTALQADEGECLRDVLVDGEF